MLYLRVAFIFDCKVDFPQCCDELIYFGDPVKHLHVNTVCYPRSVKGFGKLRRLEIRLNCKN